MLVIDLGIVTRKTHVISTREAGVWTIIWISVSMVFNVLIYIFVSSAKALEFLTGYIIEKSLSVDNIFVFLLIFAYFNIPALYQPRVLRYGIIGALILRFILILAGTAAIEAFHPMIFIFGGFLVVTGYRLAREKERKIQPEKNPLVRIFKKIIPVTSELHGERFFIKQDGVRYATTLFLVLLVVESTDLVFAVDSIPAVFAITTDFFIVYTSNAFAILGLRAMYFLLASIVPKFSYLRVGLAAILVFVGFKMILSDVIEVPLLASLAVIGGILGLAGVASYLHSRSISAASESHVHDS
jgi:tellurite resistance protein TerC